MRRKQADTLVIRNADRGKRTAELDLMVYFDSVTRTYHYRTGT